ncbi:MAG: PhzF family phenazine biosynthesis protein [Thalassospira sp.]|uniref:PhzF family phenazine biosynthesis protein n=1 Tax=Thalassospira sp. TaxID=1912094 RepID=UPI001B0E6A9F|nr:PhzF family phenazine biosynthesis protein [Thalassospira sp.]MBO6579742.1 PhzF family phenazine biosynthesis protein [Thalassospira sp.]MBO6803860.1 PhzF family phenazine biosynthesis protein [Thalassospira sp.]MBO6819729.1 PhzF family phenazine biosynthesis protein [Thalassospira sp.]MBO6886575.1 PhzF family phenazine biosynthesis protein [Thalassospira sp.]
MSTSQENTQTVPVQIVNAFVKNGQGGNPAGVVLDADQYSDAQKLLIAQKVGLSETAFVSKSETCGIKLDFFTPTKRIAHCGHATIATFSYLAALERFGDGETSKETVDGPRKIILDHGMAYMEQLAPTYTPASKWADHGVTLCDVLKSLAITSDDLDDRARPVLVNTGNNFIVVAVKDQATLANITPDQDAINAISEKLDLIGYYIFTTDTGGAGDAEIDATTRMFAPRYGITEEAATGMAAGPLACVLHDLLDIKKDSFLIAQGEFMTEPSPSQIKVTLELKDGRITGLLAGGQGKVMKNLEIAL